MAGRIEGSAAAPGSESKKKWIILEAARDDKARGVTRGDTARVRPVDAREYLGLEDSPWVMRADSPPIEHMEETTAKTGKQGLKPGVTSAAELAAKMADSSQLQRLPAGEDAPPAEAKTEESVDDPFAEVPEEAPDASEAGASSLPDFGKKSAQGARKKP